MNRLIVAAMLLAAGPAFADPDPPKDTQCEPNIVQIQQPATALTFFSSGFNWRGPGQMPGGINELPAFRASGCTIVIRRDPPTDAPSMLGEEGLSNAQHFALDFTEAEILAPGGDFSHEMAIWQLDFKGNNRPDGFLRLYVQPLLQQIIAEKSTFSVVGKNTIIRTALPYAMSGQSSPCAQISIIRSEGFGTLSIGASPTEAWTVRVSCADTQTSSSVNYDFGAQQSQTVKYGRLTAFHPIGNFTFQLLVD